MPLQRRDFTELLDAVDGLPVNIRLLDPPLHEFLPDRTELAVKVARAQAAGETGDQVDTDRKLLAAVEALDESNPMLGLRGVRVDPFDERSTFAEEHVLGAAEADTLCAEGSRPQSVLDGADDETPPWSRR